jgi:hypothetical protein
MYLISNDWTLQHLDQAVRDRFPGPGAVGWLDLGAAIVDRTSQERKDARRDNPAPLMRQTSSSAAKPVKATGGAIRQQRTQKDGVVLVSDETLKQLAISRIGKGFGRVNRGTPPNQCKALLRQWEKAKWDTPLSDCDQNAWASFCCGAVIRGFYVKKRRSVPLDLFEAELLAATQSPEAMEASLMRSVHPDVVVEQPETVKSLANLLWNMMRSDDRALRVPPGLALRHPFMSQRIFTPKQMEQLRSGEGILIPGGKGAEGTPFCDIDLPAWRLQLQGNMGVGATCESILADGQCAALYVALDGDPNVAKCSMAERPPCRNNVSILRGNGLDEIAIGELPLEMLQENRAPGVFMNAPDEGSHHTINLTLDRAGAIKYRGLIYMMMNASKPEGFAKANTFGCWKYNPFAGGGGQDSYTFNDDIFDPLKQQAQVRRRKSAV